MKSNYESSSTMPFPLEFASLAGLSGLGALRIGFVITFLALAFIVRQPPKGNRKKDGK